MRFSTSFNDILFYKQVNIVVRQVLLVTEPKKRLKLLASPKKCDKLTLKLGEIFAMETICVVLIYLLSRNKMLNVVLKSDMKPMFLN